MWTRVGLVLLLCLLCLALLALLVILTLVLTSCWKESLFLCGVHLFSDVSVNVERATQPKLASGSGWQSQRASCSSLDGINDSTRPVQVSFFHCFVCFEVSVPSPTSLLNDQAKKDGKMSGQKDCKRWQKTGKCRHRQDNFVNLILY